MKSGVWVMEEAAESRQTSGPLQPGVAATARHPVETAPLELLQAPPTGHGWLAAVRFALLV